MNEYHPQVIEPKWQQEWEESGLFAVKNQESGKENYYLLVEYPYPSGNLHIGHWYAFAVPDILARFKRMQGYNVLFPMGFDSFGLPAENAAIKRGLDPKEWTYSNIEYMTQQLKSMGNSFDWSRRVISSDPATYKWTQWLFLQLFEKGMAYRKKAEVNWCPQDQTVLANEQVLSDGTCERCSAVIEKRALEQWFLKITDYAEQLLTGLDGLPWPEEIKQSQRNWIGKSEGAELDFAVVDSDEVITVFTTRPDTVFGVTYVVLAPEHPLVDVLTTKEQQETVRIYKEAASKKNEIERTGADKEKTGVFTGAFAVNPATGEQVPVWIADYALATYGTGAVMAVPAHDERDFEFAKKFALPIVQVVQSDDAAIETAAYTDSGVLMNSGAFDGMNNEEAKWKIAEQFGRTKTTYKLRDWLISRQRYWGTPMPIVYDPEGKPHAIPKEHLPWELPTDVDFTPTGVAPLATSKELFERTERIFGKGWTPEIDTMDTFIDSSWYYLRYLDPQNTEEFASVEAQKAWMPVDRYSGGAEHTTMHLLYSRFFNLALHDLGLSEVAEPYVNRMNRGLILGPDGHKMSKSKGNVIDPDVEVEKYGADTVKMYLAFIGPYNEPGTYPWDTGAMNGIRRFLERVWKLQSRVSEAGDAAIDKALSRANVKIAADIEAMKFNTAISALMIVVGAMEKADAISRAQYEYLLTLLSPFAPHITEELWRTLGNESFVSAIHWPSVNQADLVEDVVTIGVQVNGKMRGTIEVAPTATQDVALNEVQESASLQKHLGDATPKKIIYVPGKILNIII